VFTFCFKTADRSVWLSSVQPRVPEDRNTAAGNGGT
jgi:hypothetical protein